MTPKTTTTTTTTRQHNNNTMDSFRRNYDEDGGAATSAAAAPFQRKYTSMHLASCDGLYSDLYSDMPEVRVAVTQGTGAELVKNPSVSSVPKPKPRQAFLPEEVVSIIRDASRYMTQESFAAFKADMNSKYSLGME